jgi:hypothetical protein
VLVPALLDKGIERVVFNRRQRFGAVAVESVATYIGRAPTKATFDD